MYFPLYFTEGGGYDPWGRDKNFAIFIGWLQCYNKPEMKNMGDHNKRTVFYCGDPGPMVPKGKPSRQLIEIQDKYIIQKLTLNFIVEGNRDSFSNGRSNELCKHISVVFIAVRVVESDNLTGCS